MMCYILSKYFPFGVCRSRVRVFFYGHTNLQGFFFCRCFSSPSSPWLWPGHNCTKVTGTMATRATGALIRVTDTRVTDTPTHLRTRVLAVTGAILIVIMEVTRLLISKAPVLISYFLRLRLRTNLHTIRRTSHALVVYYV